MFAPGHIQCFLLIPLKPKHHRFDVFNYSFHSVHMSCLTKNLLAHSPGGEMSLGKTSRTRPIGLRDAYVVRCSGLYKSAMQSRHTLHQYAALRGLVVDTHDHFQEYIPSRQTHPHPARCAIFQCGVSVAMCTVWCFETHFCSKPESCVHVTEMMTCDWSMIIVDVLRCREVVLCGDIICLFSDMFEIFVPDAHRTKIGAKNRCRYWHRKIESIYGACFCSMCHEPYAVVLIICGEKKIKRVILKYDHSQFISWMKCVYINI